MKETKKCVTCAAKELDVINLCDDCINFNLWIAHGVKYNDSVQHPTHYTRLPIEAIKAIKLLVTEVYGEVGYKAFCFGNELKYRLRAGFKDDAMEDIKKALKYEEFRKENSK